MGAAALGQALILFYMGGPAGEPGQPSLASTAAGPVQTTSAQVTQVPQRLQSRLVLARPEGQWRCSGVEMGMPTTVRPAGVGWPWAVLAAGAAAVFISGCSVEVRDPAVPEAVESTPVLATPTITPGHDADAVAGRDLPFDAGGTLARDVSVGISDGLKDAPGWKPVKTNVAGENQYLKADGCLVAARTRSNQGALARADDRESTVALFEYLDPTILPGYLKTDTLRWGAAPDAPPRRVEVLALEQAVPPGGRATVILARLFSTAGSSVYLSVSCPDAASLSAARADVAGYLPVLPPSN